MAALRYMRDRERAREDTCAFYFSPEHAWHVCNFVEQLPHVEGKWDTPNIRLHSSHIFILVNLFGFRDLEGHRRFTSALIAVARKNAKSTLAAAILIYCLCCEDEVGPQAISAATTGSQARIVFNIAKRMVEKTQDLREEFGLEPFANSIANYQKLGSFKPINAKASTQDGLNPSHSVLDEIHAHKSHDLLNVLQSAAGARANPLWLYTTTEGYETPGPWPELRLFIQQVLNGILDTDTDHFFGIIFALDDERGKEGEKDYRAADDDFDESKWIKANPLMEVNPILLRELRKASTEAKAMPGRHAEFKIKRLNRQSAAAAAWLNIPRWKACAGPVDLKAMEALDCWGGLDGASTMDLFAFRLTWRTPEGKVFTWGHRWVPENAVKKRSERGTVPYAGWVQSRLITMQQGRETLDYGPIEDEIEKLCNRFKPKRIKYDPWNLRDLTNRLKEKLPQVDVEDPETGEVTTESILDEFRQGAKSYHPAMQLAETLYLDGKLVHGNDPVFNWCMANVVPRTDSNMNMAPDRKRSADKIDDAAAFFMAVGAMGAPSAPASEIQAFFIG